MNKLCSFATIALLLTASAGPLNAQSIGYAQALDHLGKSCGNDIARFCQKVNLGGGRVTQCLEQNQAVTSSQCKTSVTEMRALLATRAQARAAVLRVCDADIRRLCTGN
jgi:hypothetical protein